MDPSLTIWKAFSSETMMMSNSVHHMNFPSEVMYGTQLIDVKYTRLHPVLDLEVGSSLHGEYSVTCVADKTA